MKDGSGVLGVLPVEPGASPNPVSTGPGHSAVTVTPRARELAGQRLWV